MKRFFLSLLILAVSIGLFAQKGKVSSALSYIEAGNLDKAMEALQGTETHEKTKDWAKTYYAKARLAQALYESNDAKKKAIYEDPLIVAYQNYLKALELDDNGSIKRILPINIATLSNDFLTWASETFDAEEYKKSLLAFETLIALQSGDLYVSNLDTVLIFNAGIVAINALEYQKAIKYFKQIADWGKEGSAPYEYLHSVYISLEDMENAEKALIAGYEKFPEEQNLLLSLIQFYLVNEMDEAAFNYINKAKELDPTNHRLYWAQGVLYMKQEKLEEATVALAKSIEIDDNFFDTQYNMGVCYYNMGVSKFDEANDILDNAKYNVALEGAKAVFAKAIPFMERALEINPEDIDTMKSLKELYYRLGMTEKYDAIVTKISEIEG